jgi:hypothetical protein
VRLSAVINGTSIAESKEGAEPTADEAANATAGASSSAANITSPPADISISNIVEAADSANISSFSFGSLFRSRSVGGGFGSQVEGSSLGASGYLGLLLGGAAGVLLAAAGFMYWRRRKAARLLEAEAAAVTAHAWPGLAEAEDDRL